MAKSSDESVKYNAISGRLSDYFGFKLNEGGSVSSADNVCCMTYMENLCISRIKHFANLR